MSMVVTIGIVSVTFFWMSAGLTVPAGAVVAAATGLDDPEELVVAAGADVAAEPDVVAAEVALLAVVGLLALPPQAAMTMERAAALVPPARKRSRWRRLSPASSHCSTTY